MAVRKKRKTKAKKAITHKRKKIHRRKKHKPSGIAGFLGIENQAQQ
jgi:hypothetical protein